SNLGNRPDSSEHCLGHSCLAGFGENVVQVFLHAAIPREIGIDELRRFFLFDAQLLRETERGKSVNNSKVDGLGGAAMLRSLPERAHPEDRSEEHTSEL